VIRPSFKGTLSSFFFLFFTCRYELDGEAECTAQQERAGERWFTTDVVGQQPCEAVCRYLNHGNEHEIDVLIPGERHRIQGQSVINERVREPAERTDQ